MRVAAQSAGALAGQAGWCSQLLTVMRQIVLGQPSFKKCPRINAWRAMRLKKHKVTELRLVSNLTARLKEMVVAHLKQIGCARIAGDVATELAIGFIGAHHHGQCVPAHQ